MQAVILFGYAFISNVALAVLPHEPAVIWYGPRLGVWPTTVVATAGTVAAALVDHRLFVPLIRRVTQGRDRKSTRLNSSHSQISYAVFCLKKKKKKTRKRPNRPSNADCFT